MEFLVQLQRQNDYVDVRFGFLLVITIW